MTSLFDDSICALSSPPGLGAIALIRLSGKNTFKIVDQVFRAASKKKIADSPSHKALFGGIYEGNNLIDEVLCTLFYEGKSFTGEESAEISCHGSPYVQQKILSLLIDRGARLARAGEFTQRAFLHGRMDLSQAEAVADLIASENEAAHRVALNQMRGGFSKKLEHLRQELIDFAALVELELDFGEEDVQFADRVKLFQLLDRIEAEIDRLTQSFATGNAIRNGIPVAIVGEPNVGKSTLLNALLQEEKALVSEIAGTTRDSIEDILIINGLKFRFIDTAGIRETTDAIETMGIHRTFQKIKESSIILYMVDITRSLEGHTAALLRIRTEAPNVPIMLLLNKADIGNSVPTLEYFKDERFKIAISAKQNMGLDELGDQLVELSNEQYALKEEIVVTNVRHQSELKSAKIDLGRVRQGLEEQISGEFLAMDIRKALEHLGSITGQVSTDEILGSIFGRFCIGK